MPGRKRKHSPMPAGQGPGPYAAGQVGQGPVGDALTRNSGNQKFQVEGTMLALPLGNAGLCMGQVHFTVVPYDPASCCPALPLQPCSGPIPTALWAAAWANPAADGSSGVPELRRLLAEVRLPSPPHCEPPRSSSATCYLYRDICTAIQYMHLPAVL